MLKYEPMFFLREGYSKQKAETTWLLPSAFVSQIKIVTGSWRDFRVDKRKRSGVKITILTLKQGRVPISNTHPPLRRGKKKKKKDEENRGVGERQVRGGRSKGEGSREKVYSK